MFVLGFGSMVLIIAIIELLLYIATHVFAALIAILVRLCFTFVIFTIVASACNDMYLSCLFGHLHESCHHVSIFHMLSVDFMNTAVSATDM